MSKNHPYYFSPFCIRDDPLTYLFLSSRLWLKIRRLFYPLSMIHGSILLRRVGIGNPFYCGPHSPQHISTIGNNKTKILLNFQTTWNILHWESLDVLLEKQVNQSCGPFFVLPIYFFLVLINLYIYF